MIPLTVWILLTTLLSSQSNGCPQKCNIEKRNAVAKELPQDSKFLTLQIPTFIPQFNPNQVPVFDLATANSYHTVPLVQNQNVYTPKEQTYQFQVPEANNVYPQYQITNLESSQQVPIPYQKGIIHIPSSSVVSEKKTFPEQKTLAVNNKYQTILPKGVVHLPQRFQGQRYGQNQPIPSPQNNYYIRHPVRLPHINYHILPVVPHQQRQYAPLLYQNVHPEHNYRPYSPQVKSLPLVNTQVYHPINYGPKAAPFTTPTYYGNFKPIVPKEEPPKMTEKEEINEEEEEENQDEREDYKKGFNFDENFFKNSKYTFPRFSEDEPKEKEKATYEVEDHESQEEEEEDEESMKSFVVTNPFLKTTKYPQKNNYRSNIHYGKPKEEIKVLRYTKSVNLPPREIYQARGSEMVPTVHKQKLFQQNWLYSKSSSS